MIRYDDAISAVRLYVRAAADSTIDARAAAMQAAGDEFVEVDEGPASVPASSAAPE